MRVTIVLSRLVLLQVTVLYASMTPDSRFKANTDSLKNMFESK